MDTVHPVCCGLDVHQAKISACLRRVKPDGTCEIHARDFGATMQELLALKDWLDQEGCPVAGMESTGVYWKPVWRILSQSVDVWVLNARNVKQRKGKKTDKADAKWIAELLAYGLVEPSFIPPPEISALRDLMRMRTSLVQNRTQMKSRVAGILEDTNIKLSTVVSDLFGVSGRKMLDALVQGERDPKVLSQMALGVLRRKIPQLEEALEGCFTQHHALLIRLNLELIDQINGQIAQLEDQVSLLTEPLSDPIERLATIPGVKETAARTILAEIGTDMSRFVSASRLASWAGMCPGNNESAGKRRSGRTRKGNKYLRRILTECAWAARKTPTFLGRTFGRFQARIGGQKAAMAVGHKILVIIFHLLNEESFYDDARYDRPKPGEEERQLKRALDSLARLGYKAALTPVA